MLSQWERVRFTAPEYCPEKAPPAGIYQIYRNDVSLNALHVDRFRPRLKIYFLRRG